jgi:hypothetical protein
MRHGATGADEAESWVQQAPHLGRRGRLADQHRRTVTNEGGQRAPGSFDGAEQIGATGDAFVGVQTISNSGGCLMRMALVPSARRIGTTKSVESTDRTVSC